MKGAHHPLYKPQRGFKTWKEKKRDPYYHQITLVEKKITDSETYICIHKLNSFVYQIKDGKLTLINLIIIYVREFVFAVLIYTTITKVGTFVVFQDNF